MHLSSRLSELSYGIQSDVLLRTVSVMISFCEIEGFGRYSKVVRVVRARAFKFTSEHVYSHSATKQCFVL